MANPLIQAGAPIDEALLRDLDKGRILKTERFTDTTTRNFGTGLGVGYTTPIFYRVRSGSESKIRIRFRIPARNDSGSWGGGYNYFYYSTDGGTSYTYLGNGGYDGGVMHNGAGGIASDEGEIWLENIPGDQIRIQLRHKSYDGTVTINGSHNIDSGGNSWGWTNIYVEEVST